jgi:hypothetical protein
MSTNAVPLNPGLYRVHRIFFAVFAGFAVIMLLIGISGWVRPTPGVGIGIGFVGLFFLPFAALHWYGAEGAKNGKASGRVISRIVGTVWLFGVPIGTVLGIYVWFQTGSKWKSGEQSAPAP